MILVNKQWWFACKVCPYQKKKRCSWLGVVYFIKFYTIAGLIMKQTLLRLDVCFIMLQVYVPLWNQCRLPGRACSRNVNSCIHQWIKQWEKMERFQTVGNWPVFVIRPCFVFRVVFVVFVTVMKQTSLRRDVRFIIVKRRKAPTLECPFTRHCNCCKQVPFVNQEQEMYHT